MYKLLLTFLALSISPVVYANYVATDTNALAQKNVRGYPFPGNFDNLDGYQARVSGYENWYKLADAF